MYIVSKSPEVINMIKLKYNDYTDDLMSVVGDFTLIKIREEIADGFKQLLYDYGLFNFFITTNVEGRLMILKQSDNKEVCKNTIYL